MSSDEFRQRIRALPQFLHVRVVKSENGSDRPQPCPPALHPRMRGGRTGSVGEYEIDGSYIAFLD